MSEKIVIDMGDLTLGQIDEAQKLMERQKLSEVMAFSFVYLKGKNPDTKLTDVANLKMRDIRLVPLEDEEESDPNS